MQFDHLRSLITTGKTPYTLKEQAALSFPALRTSPYIEPTLRKEVFDHERPSVILVSAVGATGKSALAQVIALAGGMPLLDLSKHKAVGDNTISGLLTNSFAPSELGGVFGGLKEGSFGIVIDGLDEGRSKTTELGFEAFLDDIATLCLGSLRPSFVLLGRTDIIDSAWLHLSGKGVSVGLLSIDPFDRSQANSYIDKITEIQGTTHSAQYIQARDAILDCLSAAFTDSPCEAQQGSFLSFIGYPPVLDAVATVLNTEQNYYRLEKEIVSSSNTDREVSLLTSISEFILKREQSEKVWVNILAGMCNSIDPATRDRVRAAGFNILEQCIRLISYCLNRELEFHVFGDSVLDMQFEEQLGSFFPDHPFLAGRKFRNAVFEAYALANVLLSDNPSYQQVAMEYIAQFRTTYHLVYITFALSAARRFPLKHVKALIAASLDFRSRSSNVELEIDGGAANVNAEQVMRGVRISLSVSTSSDEELSKPQDAARKFLFLSDATDADPIDLGSTLADTLVFLNHDVKLASDSEIKLIAPVSVYCRNLSLHAPSLSVLDIPGSSDSLVVFDADSLQSSLQSVAVVGASLKIMLIDRAGIGYPIISYLEKVPDYEFDPGFKEKYLRLRKILTHFRSHSKGQLAKFADKVENERIAGNETGAEILEKLLRDRVLYKDGKFYFIEPEQLHQHLGINWTDLRSGRVTEKLRMYLLDIP